MARVLTWTALVVFGPLVGFASASLAQWYPVDKRIERVVQMPAIPERDLDPDFESEVCFWVSNHFHRPKVLKYRVLDYYPDERDEWKDLPTR